MRALLDTNLLISYLLSPNSESATNAVIEAALYKRYTLLLPEEVVDELARTVLRKHHLAERITLKSIDRTVKSLQNVAEVIPQITEEIPQVTADPKDDYLIAYAMVGQADFLITRDDKHLLQLNKIANLAIVSPKQFIERISGQGGKSVTASTTGALKSSEPPLTAKQLREAAEKAIAEGNS